MENVCPNSQNTAKSSAAEGRRLLSPPVKHEPLGALITSSASQLGARFSGYRSRNLTCLPDAITCDLAPLSICFAASFATSALYLCFPVSPMPCLSPAWEQAHASVHLMLDYLSDLQLGLFPGECTFCSLSVLLLSKRS